MRNNRTAGHNYERKIRNELEKLGFSEVVTSRAESRNMDNKGVDIFGPDLPFHVQCKNSKDRQHYETLLLEDRLPEDKPTILFHKYTKKAEKRFVCIDEFVILRKEDFYNLIQKEDDSK